MRLVCLHADTVDALKRLKIQFDDLTPAGLWSSQYHLVGLTPDQFDALEVFHVQAEDITPAQLAQAVIERPKPAVAESATSESADAVARPTPADRPEIRAPTAETAGRESVRGGGASEAEVQLAQTRDGDARGGEVKAETKTEPKPDGKTTTQTSPQTGTQNAGAQAGGGQQGSGQKGGGKGGPQVAPPVQGNRKAQAAAQGQGGGQRYGTTRLRISVAGKYTEATVANGKIVVAGRSFDTPDQAAAELTKSRGDWTFWEYYDSTDGKWRMLTRDWDTVLKSAAPGGR
jgi:hypothetical protein